MKPWWARLLRLEVWRWPVRGSRMARARRWLNHAVRRWPTETCDACGGRVRLVWWARDGLWEPIYMVAVGTSRGASGLLCALCFTTAAKRHGHPVQWIAVPLKLPDEEWARLTQTGVP